MGSHSHVQEIEITVLWNEVADLLRELHKVQEHKWLHTYKANLLEEEQDVERLHSNRLEMELEGARSCFDEYAERVL